jgi:transposase InsO family protein
MPKSLRLSFLQQLHTAQGHLGKQRLLAAVRQPAYWPGWPTDVNRFYSTCPRCASFTRGNVPHRTPLRPIIPGEKWEVISVDIAGPFPSCNSYLYILAVQDLFSKFVLLCPLKRITAEAVADFQVNRVFMLFGYPAVILSDQGRQFDGHLLRSICEHSQSAL